MSKQHRRIFSVNAFERKILSAILLSVFIPVILVAGVFYSSISNILAGYADSKDLFALTDEFVKLFFTMLFLYSLAIVFAAYRLIHRLFGSFPRLLKELDEKISGKSKGHIFLRQGDYGHEFIVRINRLIDKFS